MAKTEKNMAEVFIPRKDGNKDPNFFVGVNGVSYLLPRGKTSTVPVEVKAEIDRALEAENAMYEAQEELQTQAQQALNAANAQAKKA